MNSNQNPTGPSECPSDVYLWVQGLILKIISEDVANDGFDYLSLDRFIIEITGAAFWAKWSLEMRTGIIKKVVKKLTKKDGDVIARMQGGQKCILLKLRSVSRPEVYKD